MTNNSEPFLSIVIPAYNEERRLPATLAAIIAFLATEPYGSEVIVVDDGSDDRTSEVAQSFPGVTVLRCDHRGKGFAVRAGALAARGDIILLCDADLAVPIEEWPRLRAAIEAGYPIAIGSREGVGASREGEPWYRHVMGRVFNWIIWLVALRGINDTQCGFKALRREVARDLFRRMRIYGDDAPIVRGAAVTAYDVELLFLAQRRGYPIAEIPVTWRYGVETKVNPFRDSWRNLRDVLRVRFNDLCGRYDVTSAPIEEVAPR
ncbi:dolichyl-phosphate beta-glucosyltransferase [Chloroflexus sp.]|uniref:dolichyl-phosphate beta-glucosyltransferase n=1 Tax=Chloroflexus sp. TaxID=1904827 RepID=UPI002636F93F|nr:dolichyl-phosphate beta-glucosyltransferase [uncultured Chloroflexus sp.]